MDRWEREGPPENVGSMAVEARAAVDLQQMVIPSVPDAVAAAPADETIFTVLAGHVRTRSSAHLWITAAIGLIDSVALALARPGLWWVSAAFAGATAYAVWGLADRRLADLAHAEPGPSPVSPGRRKWVRLALRGIKGLAVVVGIAAVLAAAAGFLGAALGRPGHG